MSKDWQRGSTFMNKDVKITKELGVGKDGYQTGGKTIEATNPFETQTVTVRGTKAMRAIRSLSKLNGIRLCGYRQSN